MDKLGLKQYFISMLIFVYNKALNVHLKPFFLLQKHTCILKRLFSGQKKSLDVGFKEFWYTNIN